jgi:polyisoprenoid-binding protein YceI
MIGNALRRGATLLGLALVVLVVRADTPGLWRIDTGESAILFEAVQAGARFEGRFERWAADVHFSPDALDASSADVRIAADSAATQNRDRDATLAGPDFFDANAFPVARYRAERFEALGDGRFRADGELTLRDVRREVPLTFAVVAAGDGWLLEGETVISRLAFELGASEDWRDTSWIGDDVTIRVRVLASAVD